MIKVKNLNKYYNKGKGNEIHVINNTNLELPSTGFIAFLGQSGSGKTTLLNVIGGLDKATGTIEYDSLVVESSKMHKIDGYRREEIGYVFQNYNLLLELSVYENLKVALEMINIYDSEEQAKRIEYVLKAVGMFKYRKKKASALSGGQQQRISIARALVKNSKIIIADEPTGNLDHENTINIMNILKNISKSTLVLMVTHNEEIANFYCDTIYNIKDGEVKDFYSPNENSTISNKNSNTIYLKDMERIEENGSNTKIEYYTDSEPKRLELRVIEKNGTFYIEANQNIKLLEGSNIRLLDKHYEAISKESIEEAEFDSSWYKNDTTHRNPFKVFIDNIRRAYQNIRAKSRKTKLLYISFIVIGMLFGISAISFSNYLVLDTSYVSVDDKLSTIEYDYKDSNLTNFLVEALNDNEIDNLGVSAYFSLDISERYNYNEVVRKNYNGIYLPYRAGARKIISGRGADNLGEVVIAKSLADKLLRDFSLKYRKYDDILGKVIELNRIGSLKIVGVNDNKYDVLYLNDINYVNSLAGFYHGDDSSINNDDIYVRSKEIEDITGYTIVGGRDLNASDRNSNTCLINSGMVYAIGDFIAVNGTRYEIVGSYTNNQFVGTNRPEIIINNSLRAMPSSLSINRSSDYSDYKIIEGRDVRALDEVVVSAYSNFKLGDIISINEMSLTVVGRFNSSFDLIGEILAKRDTVVIVNSSYSPIVFNILNPNKPLSSNNSSLYKITGAEELIISGLEEEQRSMLAVFGTLAGILIIIIVIFIYFMMRSRMISDIYSIGVYRSIGAKRLKIIVKYLFELLVITTLTSVVGYVVTLIIYSGLASGVNSLGGGEVLKLSLGLSLGGVGAIYLFNLVFGLLPISLLLTKRPAEILSKYDI